METLHDTKNNTFEKSINRKKNEGLKNNLGKFESICMTVLWTSLLEQFYKSNKILQSASIHLKQVVDLYNSLIGYASAIRNDEIFQNRIDDVKKIRNEECKLDQKHRSVQTLLYDELDEVKSRANKVILNGKEKLKSLYFAVLDQFR